MEAQTIYQSTYPDSSLISYKGMSGIQENKLIIRFGRIGTKGQVQVKTFTDNPSALKEKEKMIRDKKGKGYKG